MYLTTLQTELVKIWCGLCSCYISTQQTTEDVNIYVKYDNNSSITSFLNATLCDVATLCDAKNESISKKRPLRELCVLASHRRIASHLRKILYLNYFIIYKSFS